MGTAGTPDPLEGVGAFDRTTTGFGKSNVLARSASMRVIGKPFVR